VRSALKEAGLQTLALTNRNRISRPIEVCKQAHHCKAHGQQASVGRYGRSQWKDKCLTRGDLGLYELGAEKSAEAVVLIRKRADIDIGGLTREGRAEHWIMSGFG